MDSLEWILSGKWKRGWPRHFWKDETADVRERNSLNEDDRVERQPQLLKLH